MILPATTDIVGSWVLRTGFHKNGTRPTTVILTNVDLVNVQNGLPLRQATLHCLESAARTLSKTFSVTFEEDSICDPLLFSGPHWDLKICIPAKLF